MVTDMAFNKIVCNTCGLYLRRFAQGAVGAALVGALLFGSASWAQSVSYSYDALGRLTGATYNTGATTAYVYDAAGNRTSVTTNAAAAAKSVSLTTSGNNLNLWTTLVANGQAVANTPGSWIVTLSGTWGTTTPGVAAVDTGVFPPGSALTFTNTGTINGNFTAANFPENGIFQFANSGTITGTITK